MKSDNKNSIALTSFTVALLLLASTPANAWKYSEVEEDWGPSCVASQKHESGSITVLSAEKTFNPALLISLKKYPENPQDITVLLRVDDGKNVKLTGMVDDYIGNVYLQIKRTHIDSFIRGKRLYAAIQGGPTISASLKGSAAAFKKFLRCAGAT